MMTMKQALPGFEEFVAPSFEGIVNVATVPQRSLFRYPGGKTWLVPLIRQWLSSRGPLPELVEPFTGGGIVGLTAAFESLAEHVTLVELDPDVAAVWEVVLNGHGLELADRIRAFGLTDQTARAILSADCRTAVDRAFATIVRNRVQRGGILAPGASLMKDGENGRGIGSRWYPETLYKRIADLVEIKQRLSFIQGDGVQVIRRYSSHADAVFFIDPPYTVAGRRLYTHSQIDHHALFEAVAALAGDFLMTYDNAEEIRELAVHHGFRTELVPMKSTHHERKLELLIGRSFDWLR